MCRITTAWCCCFAVAAGLIGVTVIHSAEQDDADQPTYADLVRADGPVAYWSFGENDGRETTAEISAGSPIVGRLEGQTQLGQPGPRAGEYPRFAPTNVALSVTGPKSFVRVADPGEFSPLDFDNGDVITIEAWVNPDSLREGQQVYVVGKGRTYNPGFARENQNYALRLCSQDGKARVSFLFRSTKTPESGQEQFHRWNSEHGFVVDGSWHHVAVVYEFGQPDRIRAFIDGQRSAGVWDMGGPTAQAPVTDNDDVWIGSAMGGSAGNTFHGLIDEVAIYRHALDDQRLRERYQAIKPDPQEAEFAAAADLPSGAIVTQLFEKLPAGAGWSLKLGQPVLEYVQPAFAFVGFPKKYTSTGVIADRSNPFLIRAWNRREVAPQEAGQYRILLRAKNEARLYLDGVLITQTNPTSRAASGHEEVPEVAESEHPDIRPLPPGCQERTVLIELSEGTHVLRLDAQVGGTGLRLELDELCVAISPVGQPFSLLSTNGVPPMELTEESWNHHASELRALLATIDQENRQLAAEDWQKYWNHRHELARQQLDRQPAPAIPELASGQPAHNEIDHFIAARLAAEQIEPTALTDDYAFLRRVTLDIVGVVPSREELQAFLSDTHPERRGRVIDRLLDDPRWADHWVSYWQDVLAENPGILKPELNNTGPFRWWIYESFLDNKPMDRFATELVMMEGSKYYGGPAGFAMATQNDVPLAAKAHVLGKAFLAMDMTCARCHDAPYHPFKQRELFSLAAMLERKTIKLPSSSTVPLSEGARQPLIEITLRPGDEIAPTWPFALASLDTLEADSLMRKPGDTREQFAAALTVIHADRFAKVLVNRLWHRYLGRGLIDPVDDWEAVEGEASHPELLDYLAQQFVLSGYDLKHAAKLILTSHAYQRQTSPLANEHPQLFAAAPRRRLSAEQLVDSLFSVSGKAIRAEALTLDPEGRRPVDSFLNLGSPSRAWQFTSLSNERDRPALALPMSQSVIDLLLAYGWRDSRPHPQTVREQTTTALQPLTLANGVVGARAVRLSDDSLLTQLCLDAETPESLVELVCLQIGSRPPTAEERAWLTEAISEGFSSRVLQVTAAGPKKGRKNTVSWSNHLSAEATKIKQELEREVLAGDPPTPRLAADWRERMEDVIWALFNSPEFVFVP